jgi:hypothetical protein
MKKEIDLVKLQNIVDEPVMKNNDRLRCRGCNRPFMSLLDAYSCDCKIKGKKPYWPASKKKPGKVNW